MPSGAHAAGASTGSLVLTQFYFPESAIRSESTAVTSAEPKPPEATAASPRSIDKLRKDNKFGFHLNGSRSTSDTDDKRNYFLLGTDTQYASKTASIAGVTSLDTIHGETLSALHNCLPGSVIVDGPVTQGLYHNAVEIAAHTTALMLYDISAGAKVINIAAHSRGSIEALLIAHELDRIKKALQGKKIGAKDIKDIILNSLDPEGLTKKILEQEISLLTDEQLIQIKENIDKTSLNLYLLDPVPGNRGMTTFKWEDVRICTKEGFIVADIVDKAHIQYAADERTGFFDCAICRRADTSDPNCGITLDYNPGHHGTASGRACDRDLTLKTTLHLFLDRIASINSNKTLKEDAARIEELKKWIKEVLGERYLDHINSYVEDRVYDSYRDKVSQIIHYDLNLVQKLINISLVKFFAANTTLDHLTIPEDFYNSEFAHQYRIIEYSIQLMKGNTTSDTTGAAAAADSERPRHLTDELELLQLTFFRILALIKDKHFNKFRTTFYSGLDSRLISANHPLHGRQAKLGSTITRLQDCLLMASDHSPFASIEHRGLELKQLLSSLTTSSDCSSGYKAGEQRLTSRVLKIKELILKAINYTESITSIRKTPAAAKTRTSDLVRERNVLDQLDPNLLSALRHLVTSYFLEIITEHDVESFKQLPQVFKQITGLEHLTKLLSFDEELTDISASVTIAVGDATQALASDSLSAVIVESIEQYSVKIINTYTKLCDDYQKIKDILLPPKNESLYLQKLEEKINHYRQIQLDLVSLINDMSFCFSSKIKFSAQKTDKIREIFGETTLLLAQVVETLSSLEGEKSSIVHQQICHLQSDLKRFESETKVLTGSRDRAATELTEVREKLRTTERARNAATAATAVAVAGRDAAEAQVGVAKVATDAATARAAELERERNTAQAATAAVVARAKAAENALKHYKTILKFTAFLTAGTTYGISKVFSLIPIQASVLTSFMSPAAAFTPSSQAVSFGAQPIDTTYSPVTGLEISPVVESVVDTLATCPANASRVLAAFDGLATAQAGLSSTPRLPVESVSFFDARMLQYNRALVPVTTTLEMPSFMLNTGEGIIAAVNAYEQRYASPFLSQAAIATAAGAVPAVANTVTASAIPAVIATPAVADAAIASFESLITVPATYAAQALTYVASYAGPVVANTTATTVGTLAAIPAVVATNASTGICLIAEAAEVCAAELTASGAIFTSLLTPVAIATGLGSLAVLGAAAAYYGYKYYQKSEQAKTVKTEEVVPELTTSTPVKLVPEVTLAAPVDIIKPKKAVDVVEIVPAIDIVIKSPIQEAGAKTEVKESTNCKADAIAKDEPIIPPAKIISITPWKLGIYTGFAVTTVVGTTLAVYFVAPLVAPIIMAYVATAHAAVMNFALQHAFLIPVINALTSIANYSSQLAAPVINILANFTNLLGNIVTVNSATYAAIGVKSLMLTAGSGAIGAAVGCAAAPVVSAAATTVANKFEM